MSYPLTRREAAMHERMSDDQYNREVLIIGQYARALAAMNDAVRRIKLGASCAEIDADVWEDFVHDELPSIDAWQERLEAAHRG